MFWKGRKSIKPQSTFHKLQLLWDPGTWTFSIIFPLPNHFFLHTHTSEPRKSLQTSNSLDFNFLWMNNQFLYELFIQGYFYSKNWKKVLFLWRYQFKKTTINLFLLDFSRLSTAWTVDIGSMNSELCEGSNILVQNYIQCIVFLWRNCIIKR